MTFRKYSKLISSSPCTLVVASIEDLADPVLGGAPEAVALTGVAEPVGVPGRPFERVRDKSGVEPLIPSPNEVPIGVRGLFALQYPTPGFLCRSRRAAEDCTLRNSSFRV
jgi:hypothetical protein